MCRSHCTQVFETQPALDIPQPPFEMDETGDWDATPTKATPRRPLRATPEKTVPKAASTRKTPRVPEDKVLGTCT